MLADATVVTAVAVTDLDRSKRFFSEQLGLSLLDETPFAIRFGAGKGTQISVRRGQPNVGQTAAHFEVDDIESVILELTSRGVTFDEYEAPKTVGLIAQNRSGSRCLVQGTGRQRVRPARGPRSRECVAV